MTDFTKQILRILVEQERNDGMRSNLKVSLMEVYARILCTDVQTNVRHDTKTSSVLIKMLTTVSSSILRSDVPPKIQTR